MWNMGTIRWGKRYFAGGRKFFYISKVLETHKKLGTIYGWFKTCNHNLPIPILLKEVKYYDISFFWWYCVYLQRFHACRVCVDSMVTIHVSLNFASIFFSLSLAAGSIPGGWLVMIVTCGIIILSAQRRGSRASNEDSWRLHENFTITEKVPCSFHV